MMNISEEQEAEMTEWLVSETYIYELCSCITCYTLLP